MENDFSDDEDEMGCDVKVHLGCSGRDSHENGAFHTQKLSGSVTLDSISSSTTIFKSNYSHSSEIKTEKTHFNHVLPLGTKLSDKHNIISGSV